MIWCSSVFVCWQWWGWTDETFSTESVDQFNSILLCQFEHHFTISSVSEIFYVFWSVHWLPNLVNIFSISHLSSCSSIQQDGSSVSQSWPYVSFCWWIIGWYLMDERFFVKFINAQWLNLYIDAVDTVFTCWMNLRMDSKFSQDFPVVLLRILLMPALIFNLWWVTGKRGFKVVRFVYHPDISNCGLVKLLQMVDLLLTNAVHFTHVQKFFLNTYSLLLPFEFESSATFCNVCV